MIDQLWLIPLGFSAGILGSIIGIGGGIIIVPVLTFFGFTPTLAASNSLFATLSNAVASTISYSRGKNIEWSLGVKLGLLSIPGTVIGAILSSDAAPELFKVLFGLVLAASAAYLFLRRRIETRQQNNYKHLVLFVAGASFFAGLISSFFGIGGGIVFVPLMVAGLGMTMKKAAPTSQLILLFASFSGVLAHSLLGHPDFFQAGLLAVGSFFGGLVGSRLALGAQERFLQILISSAMLVAAAKLFLDSIYVVS